MKKLVALMSLAIVILVLSVFYMVNLKAINMVNSIYEEYMLNHS